MYTPSPQTANPETTAQLQLTKLKRLIAYAKKHSPFYREKLRKISPNDLTTLNDLKLLPFTSRADLETRNRDFFCVPEEQISDYCRTSGTTGRPLYIGMTRSDLDNAARMCAELMPFLDLGPKPSFALLLPLDELINPSTCLERTFREVLKMPVYRIGAGYHPRIIEYLTDLKPTVALATPYLLYTLSRKYPQAGASLKTAILLGQPVNGPNWEKLEIKKRIEENWGLEVYSAYGSTEVFSGFFECRAHRGHHIQWHDLIVEIVNPQTGEPLPGGEVGEVAVTTLYRRGLPLIRYLTRDLSRLETGPCPCGANSPRVMAVLGRKDHFMKIKGTGLFPQQIENALLRNDLVHDFLIQVYRDGEQQDLIKLLVSSKASIETLQKYIKRELLFTPRVEILDSAAILQLQTAGSQKPRRFQDLRERRTA